MEADQRKSLREIAEDILRSRLAAGRVSFDETQGRFIVDTIIEALHSNDAYLKHYSEAQTLKARLKSFDMGEGEKHLSKELAAAHAEIGKLRGQLSGLSRFTGVLPPTDEPTKAKPLPAAPKIGLLFALLLGAAPAVADVRDPVTTVCPEGTTMRQRFDSFVTNGKGQIATDDVGNMRILVDVVCVNIMPKIKKLPPPEVVEWEQR